jgi:hypothetical protein
MLVGVTKRYNSGAVRQEGGLPLYDFLNSLIHSPKDWVIGLVAAFVIWAVGDLLPVGDSRIRGLVRWVRNKLSEQSVARLKKRIEQLEKAKKNLDLILNSDKALYLYTFRALFGTLLLMCGGAMLTTLRHSEMLAAAQPPSPDALVLLDLVAIMVFALAFTVALSAVIITVAEDNTQKLAAQAETYGKEIESLKRILNERLEKLQRRG